MHDDFHDVGKMLGEAAAGASAVYLLSEGRRRPVRDYEGGLIPDPVSYGTADQAAFIAGGMILRYLILHFVVIPFLVVWAGVMALPPLAWSRPGAHFTWYDGAYLAITGLLGLRILVGIKRVVDGRPTRRRGHSTPAVATVPVRSPEVPIYQECSVCGHWDRWDFGRQDSGLLVPVDEPLLPPGPALP